MEEGEKFKAAKRIAETLLADGIELEVVLARLRSDGVTMVQSMLVLIRVQGLSLVEAREAVHTSETWSDQREKHDEFHELLAQTLEIGVLPDVNLDRGDESNG